MKIAISEAGTLMIERAGKMKAQQCPLSTSAPDNVHLMDCGDWCPLFREPIRDEGRWFLGFCDIRFLLETDDFEDQRIKTDKE